MICTLKVQQEVYNAALAHFECDVLVVVVDYYHRLLNPLLSLTSLQRILLLILFAIQMLWMHLLPNDNPLVHQEAYLQDNDRYLLPLLYDGNFPSILVEFVQSPLQFYFIFLFYFILFYFFCNWDIWNLTSGGTFEHTFTFLYNSLPVKWNLNRVIPPLCIVWPQNMHIIPFLLFGIVM